MNIPNLISCDSKQYNHLLLFINSLLCSILLLLNTSAQALPPSSEQLEKTSIILKWRHQFQFAGYYAAKEKGFYKDEGLDVSLVEWKPNQGNYIDQVISKQYDYGIADSGLIHAKLTGKPVAHVSQIFQHSPLILITLKESGLETPISLKNKVIDLGPLGMMQHLPVYIMLQKNISLNSEKPKTHFNYQDLIDKKVDAILSYITDQPFWYKQQGVDINIINPKDFGIDFYGDALFTSTQEVHSNPERIKKMHRATLKGWQYALDNPSEIIDLIIKKYNTQNLTREHLQYEAEQIRKTINPDAVPIGTIEDSRIQKIAVSYAQYGLAKTSNLDESFYAIKPETQHINQTDEKHELTGVPIHPAITLSHKEIKWLNEHPTIYIGASKNFPPYSFLEDGEFKGFAIDYLKMLAKKAGFTVKFKVGTLPEHYGWIQTGKTHLLATTVKNKKYINTFHYSPPYLTGRHILLVQKENNTIKNLQNLSGKTLSIRSTTPTIPAIRRQAPTIKVLETNTIEDAIKAVSLGKSDATLIDMASGQYLSRKLGLSNLKVASEVNIFGSSTTPYRFASHKSNPELISILNKCMEAFDPRDYSKLYDKWIGLHTPQEQIPFSLTETEKKWLKNHPTLQVGVGDDWMPFEATNSSGEVQGISSDYINTIETLLHVNVHTKFFPSFLSKLEGLRSGQADIFPMISRSNNTSAELNFSKPHTFFPAVILTQKDKPAIKEISDLSNKKIATLKGVGVEQWLFQQYPSFNYHRFSDLDDALLALSQGNVDAFIVTSAASSFAIKKLGIDNIVVAAPVDYQTKLSFGVRKDWPELIPILNKLIDAIPDDERQLIEHRWQNIQFQKQTNWLVIWKWIFAITLFFSVLLLLFFIWNRRLAKEIQQRKQEEFLRKKAETTLLKSELQLSLALESAKVGLVDWDITTGAFYTNSVWGENLELTKDEMPTVFSDWQAMVHPDDRTKVTSELNKNFSKQTEYYECEYRLKIKSGKWKWVQARGKVVDYDSNNAPSRHISIVIDIDQQKHTEKEKEILLEKLNNNLNELSCLYDISSQIQNIDLSPEQLFQKIVDRIPPAWPEALTTCARMTIDDTSYCTENFKEVGTKQRVLIQTNNTPTGSIEVFCLNESEENNYLNKNSALLSVIAQRVADVIEFKESQNSLQLAKEVAESANQAKSRFLANMSHELRTPLNAILGFAQLLTRDQTISKDHKDELAIILKSGEHLLALINDILDMSKIEAAQMSLTPSDIDFKLFIQTLGDIFTHKAELKNLQFKIDLDSQIPQFINTDQGKLRQILTNLLDNAIKFTDQGSVTLRISKEQKKTIGFEVTDTGSGIPSDEISQIFSPFRQVLTKTTRDKGGTGLGLAISKQFAELLGGELSVHSTLNQGSTFLFAIPLVQATHQPYTPNPATIKKHLKRVAPGQKNFKLLIVEDVLENRLLLSEILSSAGFEVKEAVNGKEGVELFNSFKPDLVWMDMRMPTMDGFEATRQIKMTDFGNKTPVIALTAQVFKEDRQAILDAGCDDYIGKPFAPEEIFSILTRFLGVKYTHEDSSKKRVRPTLSTQLLTDIPQDVIESLKDNVLLGDTETCHKILDELENIDSKNIQSLKDLIDNYQFEKLYDLLTTI